MYKDFLGLLRGKNISSLSGACGLIPLSVSEAELIVDEILSQAALLKKELLSYEATKRTYDNTVKAYDALIGLLGIGSSVVGVFRQISSEVSLRNKPYERFQNQATLLCKDASFYDAFCQYRDNGMSAEVLSKEQQYFFEKSLADFVRCGYDKDKETFEKITALEYQMLDIASSFDRVLNDDVTTVSFYQSELTGIAPEFVAAQSRDAEGKVVLLCNKPTANAVLPYCSNKAVRKAFKKAYDRRAYPANAENLQQLLTLRSKYSALLGYENYAAYALSSYMIGSTSAASDFLSLLSRSMVDLHAQEVVLLHDALPEGAQLVDGKLEPWDVSYVLAHYKQKTFHFDERLVSQFFPVDVVLAGIMAIYEKFMGVSFKRESAIPGAWHDSVQGVTVYTKDTSRVLGYILLDLFPRPQKYSHACCWEVVPRVWGHHPTSGMLYESSSVSVIVANFPLPQGDAPSLLMHSDVTTFFHEFGHALHNVLSCTAHTQTTGSMHVMLDFVELPSQILEEWMWDAQMLGMVSSHYQTNDRLPVQTVEKMVGARFAGQGFFEMNQVYFSTLSLNLHMLPPPVDLDKALFDAFNSSMGGVAWDSDNKFYASFGHLPSYGPGYYGYSLSRAYAHDVFSRIKTAGLLNEKVGSAFVEKILRPGGSQHPLALLESFLDRPVTSETYTNFLKALIK